MRAFNETRGPIKAIIISKTIWWEQEFYIPTNPICETLLEF